MPPRIKIKFLGVGEAADENLANTSVILQTKNHSLMLDCGYSVPQALWRYNPDNDFPDAVYITHSHADHFFGVPLLILRRWEAGVKKPLSIICHPSLRNTIKQLLKLSYEKIFLEFRYEFIFVKKSVNFYEFKIEIAPSGHSQKNYSAKITVHGKKIGYSGDGNLSQQTRRLFSDCDLLIHEAYYLQKGGQSHGDVKGLIDYIKGSQVKKLALVHLCRYFREKIIRFVKEQNIKNIFVPEPFDEVVL